MKINSNKTTIFFLSLFFVFGLALRLYKLNDGIIFGYDQARDAYRARAIFTEGKLKLLGPETDIPGVHHGVGYYYLLALPYRLSTDPFWAAAFFTTLNALGIFLAYWAGWKFFQDRRIALMSALLYTVSFEIIQYGRWLSNPSLAIITVLLSFLGFWDWINGKKWGIFWALIWIACSLHFQFFLIYLYLVPFFFYLIYRPVTYWKMVLYAIIGAFIIDSTFIISELKFGFQATKAFLQYFSGQSSVYKPVSEFLIRYFDRFVSVVFHAVVPFNGVIAFVLLVAIIVALFKKQNSITKKHPAYFLLLWLFSSFPMFIFSSGALNSEFSFVGVSLSFIFLTAWVVSFLWQRKEKSYALIILVFIIVTNIRFSTIHAQDGAYIFSVQRVMTYGLEKQIIDYTYTQAKGQPFSICTLTNPLFINTLWAYLYTNYGKNRYGYVPYWAGAEQQNNLGSLPADISKPQLRYLIFEPVIGLPPHAPELFVQLEDYISDTSEEKNFGDFRVQKRILLNKQDQINRRNSYTSAYNKEHDKEGYLLYRCFH